ncbi:50S ribosomal protein L11 methyltransferase [Aurantibacillus circumpalustris]|uniref:50S ribosomal protein L11 methyltransferase n=1 Tax=Aurantibacillus circumpalustris TaxID=3036359 RepID=UPI00295BA0A0|nr:50S ribosomal protein L11 methyltransferase [Aurantibacillus circumpalustris]
MSYLAYNFNVNPPQPGSDILIAMISEFGFESFDHSDTGFTAYIKEEEAMNVDFSELQFEDFTYKFNIEKIAATNWNAEWENNFEPVFVGNLLCIRAPFHNKNAEVKHEIVIMPKMSFGTGHHQTTRLMCRQMFETDFKNKRVLDMGTGTGILAILAKILGAVEVIGIDIDEWSVENSKENCASNGYPDIILKMGDVDLLEGEKPFDVILANINKNILKKQIPSYSKIMTSGTTLFLSGFFTTDVEELSSVASANEFNFSESFQENEWAMMVLQKK